MLGSTFCGCSDKCIIAKGTTDILSAVANENDKAQRDVVFKSNAPFRSCISQINNILIDNGEDLDAVMPIHNPLEYSDNYSRTPRCLWNQYRDEIEDVDDNAPQGKSFEYKTKKQEKLQEAFAACK